MSPTEQDHHLLARLDERVKRNTEDIAELRRDVTARMKTATAQAVAVAVMFAGWVWYLVTHYVLPPNGGTPP